MEGGIKGAGGMEKEGGREKGRGGMIGEKKRRDGGREGGREGRESVVKRQSIEETIVVKDGVRKKDRM